MGWPERLARQARPIVLVVAGLLAGGALLTVLGLPFVGWPVYALGHVGLLVALPALAAAYRRSLPAIAWIWLALAIVGLVLGLLVVALTWAHYLANPALQEVVPAHEIVPLGMVAGVAAWLGVALFGIVALSAPEVPRGGSLVLVVAAALIIAAELNVLAAYVWALAIVLAAIGLVWLAPLSAEEAVALDEAEVQQARSLGSTEPG